MKFMVKKIRLTQNQVALVDDEDFEFLNQFKWQAHWRPHINQFYAVHSVKIGDEKFKTKYMHRMILTPPKNKVIDHKDNNPLNNQKSNLRIVSTRQNQHNLKKGKMFPPGATWHKGKKCFEGGISFNQKRKYLGTFKDHLTPAILYEFCLREGAGEELICKIGGA